VKTENEKEVGINCFLSCKGGVRWSLLVLQPQMGLKYQLLMTDVHEALVE
jgi:hypothetical protein